MTSLILNHDIFDRKGVLLLRKGQNISEETIFRLKRLGINGLDKAVTYEQPVDQQFGVSKEDYIFRKSIKPSQHIDKAHDVLCTTIFESKHKEWWMYVNALANYVSWLYTHSIDVAMLSLIIASELNCKDDEMQDIALGSLLHDVGKLLVPKQILQKESKHAEAERMMLDQHCDLGISSLARFELNAATTDIIFKHHERLDGSGYPYGIKADEIKRNVRIVMVADVFDEKTSYCPYRECYPKAYGINHLKYTEGKYPQEIVSVLERILA